MMVVAFDLLFEDDISYKVFLTITDGKDAPWLTSVKFPGAQSSDELWPIQRSPLMWDWTFWTFT